MRKNRAFTLPELLVVVVIIVLLIALLMPQLSKAKDTVKQARCQSNLKAIGIAIFQYMAQNNDITPEREYMFIRAISFGPGFQGTYPDNPGPFVMGTWQEQLVADGCVAVRLQAGTTLSPYAAAGRGIFLCPSGRDSPHVEKYGDAATDMSYGLSKYFTSVMNYGTGIRRAAPTPQLRDQPDHDNPVFPNGGNPNGDKFHAAPELVARIYRGSRNMRPSGIIAFDGNHHASRSGTNPYFPGKYAMHPYHFNAPNCLFGDGRVEWGDQHQKTRPRLGYEVEQVPVNASVWQHVDNNGALDPIAHRFVLP
ncbi:MAG: prepilin-type N-terminal cleavage/methylation domain-containing protein [Phycisphaerales bacterium]|nr:prepilin-type N-terminal cleavage/methylation domain-containing protein [Phycisphaerales bacterium]